MIACPDVLTYFGMSVAQSDIKAHYSVSSFFTNWKGSADAVACLPGPRVGLRVFSSFLLFAWWPPLLFLEDIIYGLEGRSRK
jgi:hypothetical protein